MGVMIHHAIVVTSFRRELIAEACAKAHSLGLTVTGVVDSKINAYWSFMIAPDGSKEFWPESDIGDERRKAWKEWAAEQAYEDGSTALEYVEVAYGEFDPSDAQITQHAWSNRVYAD